MQKQLEKKHPLAVRWLHWVNFPLLTMMIWSGILIYWANQVYAIRVFGNELFKFFPPWFYDYLSIPFRLAEGLQLHFFFMWFFAGKRPDLRDLHDRFRRMAGVAAQSRASFKRAPLVALHDAHIVKKLPPQGKYNDAQRIAYTSIISDGCGFGHYGPRDLQTHATVVADRFARRLRMGAAGSIFI